MVFIYHDVINFIALKISQDSGILSSVCLLLVTVGAYKQVQAVGAGRVGSEMDWEMAECQWLS